jgi:hypothetical protein
MSASTVRPYFTHPSQRIRAFYSQSSTDLRKEYPFARYRQRGATMVSVMLLTVSLLTVAVLVVRSANREVAQANAVVARERALLAAQATIELGAAQYRLAMVNSPQGVLDSALAGYNPSGDPTLCSSVHLDCIPGGGGDPNAPATGQRNRHLTGKSDCAGRPCMRQGAVARLADSQGGLIDWSQVPLRDLIQGGDPEVRVSLWIRNNTADVLDGGVGGGSWIDDDDGRVVLTAMAVLRNTTVAIEQEFVIGPPSSAASWSMTTPDTGYGAGHNNDNVIAEVCQQNYLGYQETP